MNDTSKTDALCAGLPAVTATIQYGTVVPGREEYIYDTFDRNRTNLALERYDVPIYDARADLSRFSLFDNGFALTSWDSSAALEARGEGAVGEGVAALKQAYHDEMVPLVREVSGTPHVFAQDSGFLIRHGKKSTVKTAARPASFAHCDYTQLSAEMTRDRVLEMAGQKASDYRHFAVFQTWRAVSPPPQDSLLTFCDGRTVGEDDCLTVKNINGPEDEPGNIFFNKLGLARDWHRWYYFSGLEADEVALFLAYDSRRTHQLNVLHTSFFNPLVDENAVPRASVEARFFAFYE